MKYLLLKREESEPLRQSYERTWVYMLHDGVLYYRRFAFGRIQEDIVERIVLSTAELQQLTDFVSQQDLQQNLKDLRDEEIGQLHLGYKITLEQGQQKYEQKIGASSRYISEELKYVDQLWRLLAGFVSVERTEDLNEKLPSPVSLDLMISSTRRSRDTEIKIRSYQLRGTQLHIEHVDKGRFRSSQQWEKTLSPEEESQLASLLVHELGRLNGKYDLGESKAPPLIRKPFVEAQLNITIGEQQNTLIIKGNQDYLLDQISFLLIEKIEKILSE